jgi:hypothetical protein
MDFIELAKILRFFNGSQRKLWYLLSQIFTRHLNLSKEICFEHITSLFYFPCSNISNNINISRCLGDLSFEIAISKHLRLLKNPNSQTREFTMGILGMFPYTPKNFSPFMEIIFTRAYSSHVPSLLPNSFHVVALALVVSPR